RGVRAVRGDRRDRGGDRRGRLLPPGRAGEADRGHGRPGAVLAGPGGPHGADGGPGRRDCQGALREGLMPTPVVMPALELAQETGQLLRWLKAPGDRVQQGEPLVEIETDKVTTEIEAPVSGFLGELTARDGDVVPVGRAIAVILEAPPAEHAGASAGSPAPLPPGVAPGRAAGPAGAEGGRADGGGLGLGAASPAATPLPAGAAVAGSRSLASPKARRLAGERGLDLGTLVGSGPGGAVLAGDVLAAAGAGAATAPAAAGAHSLAPATAPAAPPAAGPPAGVGTVWRIMAERMTASWTSAPHFYLVREVDVSRLVAWRAHVREGGAARVTYTDLLVKLVAAALARHPAVNAAWRDGAIARNADVDIGLAVAVEEGLVVPVLRRADALGVAQIAAMRED